jgi:type IV secretion system protein VirB6
MWYGYQMVMGNSQASAKDFVFKAVRAWIIIAFATGLAASMGFSIRAVTTDLTNLISESLTGDAAAGACTNSADNDKYGLMGCKIDKNLARTQAAMAFVSQLDAANDPVLEDKKARASLFAGAGIGGPAIVAGALMLTLKVSMALFICLGPIFIMCLLFKQTSQLFWKWLYYGLATMFATAMLAVVSDIAMDLVENISGALFVTNIFNSILGGTDATAGVMQASLQQFGLGLILSTLLITTPPMAGSFFSQMMGQFQSQSAFQHWAGGVQSQAPQGNLGSAGVPTATVGARGANGAPAPLGRNDIGNSPNSSPVPANAYIPQTNAAVNQDVVKTSSAVGNARVSDGFASSEVAQSDKSIKDQVVKAGLIVVSGALLWANGGAVKQVNAEPWGDGVCRAGWYVDDHYGCVSADGACYYHPNGASNPDCSIGSGNTNNSNGGFNTPIRQEPSSYGAVAWDIKKILIGTAINQASKQDAINIAMQKCGKASCKVTTWYANQCVAVGDGDALSKKAIYWYTALGLTQEKAEQNLLASCSKNAKNCRVAFSECSLP